jgi:hypothetical protein
MFISWSDCDVNPAEYFAEYFEGQDVQRSLQELVRDADLDIKQRILVWDALFNRDAYFASKDKYAFMRTYWRNGLVKSLPEACEISRAMQTRSRGTGYQKIVKQAFPTNPRAAKVFTLAMGARYRDEATGVIVRGSALDLYGITGVKPRKKQEVYLTLEKAMEIVHPLLFKNPFQYAKYIRAHKEDNMGLPANPPKYYKHEKSTLTWDEYLNI